MARWNPPYLSRAITVVDYDPSWPASFRAECARISTVVGDLIIELEHFGSTAVPGLAAKPIIDMLAGVRDVEAAAARMGGLLGIAYEDFGLQVPGRYLFARGGPANEATHHLHVVEHRTAAWLDPLRFRDRLRADPALVQRYAQLKRELAATHGRDIRGLQRGQDCLCLFSPRLNTVVGTTCRPARAPSAARGGFPNGAPGRVAASPHVGLV